MFYYQVYASTFYHPVTCLHLLLLLLIYFAKCAALLQQVQALWLTFPAVSAWYCITARGSTYFCTFVGDIVHCAWRVLVTKWVQNWCNQSVHIGKKSIKALNYSSWLSFWSMIPERCAAITLFACKTRRFSYVARPTSRAELLVSIWVVYKYHYVISLG